MPIGVISFIAFDILCKEVGFAEIDVTEIVICITCNYKFNHIFI